MKILLLLLIMLLSINVSLSQDTLYNFSVVKNEIVWQRVYDTSLSIDQLDQEIRNSGLFEEIERDGNTFRGSVKRLHLKAGISTTLRPRSGTALNDLISTQ